MRIVLVFGKPARIAGLWLGWFAFAATLTAISYPLVVSNLALRPEDRTWIQIGLVVGIFKFCVFSYLVIVVQETRKIMRKGGGRCA